MRVTAASLRAARLRGALLGLLLILGRPALAWAATDGFVDVQRALAALQGADLVVVDDPRPGRPPSVMIATRVQAPPLAIAAVLNDPRAYPQAIPSLIRADIVGRRPGAGRAGDDRLLQWELEIPLFNLKGKAWVSPRIDGVDLILTEGDLAPGRLSFTWAVDTNTNAGAGAGTILTVESQANMRAAGWLFRRIAAHSPFGESAMNAAAAYVVLRAAAEQAQHPGEPAARRPHAPPEPPAGASLTRDVGALGEAPALAPFRRRGVVAAVRSAASGRLAAVTVAVPVALDAEALAARLAAPSNWPAFPGWHRVTPLPGDRVALDDNLPFVDLDTIWQLRRDRPLGFSARASEGATRGALFAWDVRGPSGAPAPAPAPAAAHAAAHASLAVFSLYPRLEVAGYIPRKFIAAEPLLEHAMTLALAYVDAMSMARAVARPVPERSSNAVTR